MLSCVTRSDELLKKGEFLINIGVYFLNINIEE